MRFGNASVRDVCILDHLHLDAVLPHTKPPLKRV